MLQTLPATAGMLPAPWAPGRLTTCKAFNLVRKGLQPNTLEQAAEFTDSCSRGCSCSWWL